MYSDKITDKLANWYFSNPKISMKTDLKKKEKKREKRSGRRLILSLYSIDHSNTILGIDEYFALTYFHQL